MGLQLKEESNHTESKRNVEQNNPWNVPETKVTFDIEEPKVVYNTAMAEAQAKQKGNGAVVGTIIKMLIVLAVCGLVVFAAKKVVSVLAPAGQDITAMLTWQEDKVSASLGEVFVDNPIWAADVYHYSKGNAVIKGAEDIGVVYIDGRQIGVHIDSNKYTIFGVQVGDGEKNMYDNTTYPYDSFISIMDTMGDKSTLYIYYNQSRNDCIFFRINNTTNRIETMTYYSDFRKVTELLDVF